MSRLKFLAFAFAALLFGGICAASAKPLEQSVGFQWAEAADPDDKPIKLAIWYPSDAPARDQKAGPFTLNVAMNGAMRGTAHPLIVMSHGTGGSSLGSYNIATTLAKAGFIVVAVSHTGDNYMDHSHAFTRGNFTGRPHHIKRTIDFMLSTWRDSGAIDIARIGIFGHSAGGATALIAIGGKLDWRQIASFCQTNTGDWGCKNAKQQNAGAPAPADIATPIAETDPRIKAAVIAAPALSYGFQPQGLSGVSVPLQLWVAADDKIVTDAELVESLMPRPIAVKRIANGGHFSFLAPCSFVLAQRAPEICLDTPGFDRTAFQKEFAAEIVKFFLTTLPSTAN